MDASTLVVPENIECNPNIKVVPLDSKNSFQSAPCDVDYSTIHRNLRRSPNCSHSLKRMILSNQNRRTRSASLGRDSKTDLKARYWAFLFENLGHVVDGLYQTCETDESISECKEVILVLENYTREFHNLIEWFRVKWEFENTPVPQRPNSMAWEIRKSSPGNLYKNACRKCLFELSEHSFTMAEGIENLPQKSLNSKVDVSNDCKNEGAAKNQLVEDSSTKGTTLESAPKSHSREIIVKDKSLTNRSSQADHDSAFALVKKQSASIVRKTPANGTSSLRKVARSSSVSNVCDLKSNSLSVSSSATTLKRFSTCTSPKKPQPGINVSAAEFIPGKLSIKSSSDSKSSTTDAVKIGDSFHRDPIAIETKIPRSQSDPVFNTIQNNAKKSAAEGKPRSSVELVENNNQDKSIVCHAVDSIAKSLNSSGCSLQVIDERDQSSKTPAAVDGERCSEANNVLSKEVSNCDFVHVKANQSALVESGTDTGVAACKLVVDKTPTKTTVAATELSAKSLSKTDGRPVPIASNVKFSGKKSNIRTETAIVKSAATTVGEIKCDVIKKNSRYRVGNGSCTATRSGTGSRQYDQNRFANPSSLPRPKPMTTQTHCQSNQTNSIFKRNEDKNSTIASIVTSVAEKNTEKEKTKTDDSTIKRQVSSGADEKSRLFRGRSNNYSSMVGKSNSFQGGIKRDNRVANSSHITRSKTSIDLQYVNDRNRVTNSSKSVPIKEKNVKSGGESNNSPRHRRSSKDIDGWETVIGKSRRSIPNSSSAKSKSFDVNNRFYEPSSSTSLPILALEDDVVGTVGAEINTKGEIVHLHPAHSRPHPNIGVKSKSTLEMKSHNKNRNRNNSHSSNNSGGNHRDSTSVVADKAIEENGPLVEASVHHVVVNVDRDNYKSRKERPIISNTAMFTNIHSKRRKPNDRDSRKVRGAGKDGKNSDNCSVIAAGANARKNEDLMDDEESLRKSEELYKKEISLQNEINELQKDADLETADADSDSTEVDQEIVDLCNNNDKTRRAVLEEKYEHVLTGMSWADRTVTLDKLEELLVSDPSGRALKFAKGFTSLKQFEDLISRAPGRALEIHQRLSSPSRKRTSPDSTIMQHEAKLAKAQQNREQLLQDKSAKIRELLNKVDEVRAMQAQLDNERRKSYDEKLKRAKKAEENRNLYLKNIQEKAHDEAKKQKEIAFINELEAQNKRHDFEALCQEQEERLQTILGERQRRQEEKAAKEAAVEERRKAIEAERQEKIEELQEKMRKREERIDRELQEKERERIKMAREKARDREDRLLALQAAQIANVEELQKKIQQKQENSARRHEENIELIRQKAIEIGTPRLTPYQINKLCSVCSVVIDSEVFLLSHLRGRAHQEAVKKYREQFEVGAKFNERSIIIDAPADVLHRKRSREKERQNTLRKRCKKIRHRLSNRSEEYLKNISTKKETWKKIDSTNKGKILKSIKEIEKLISTQGKGVWPNNAVTILERNLFDVIRILEKCHADDQRMFREFEGFAMLSKVYDFALDLPKNMSPYLPLKCFIVTSNLFAVACNRNVENCLYVLLSNSLIQILDFLLNRLNLIMPNSDDRNGMVVYKADSVADVLMSVCSNVLSTITSLISKKHDYQSHNNGGDGDYDLKIVSAHLCDVVSYVVCTGIVDKLAVYCSSVHDNKSADSYFLLHCMELLTQLVETRRGNITNKEDCTQLMATLKATELVGAVSMLYAILLHQDSMSNENSSAPAVLQPDVVNVIIATLRLFSKVAELNLKFFQNILGAEGISLQVRHIISYLLRYCTQNDCCKNLLHQVIEFIGFFAIHHTDNQLILQSGSTPTVLQQLSSLPFAYFSNPVLVRILFPTLLACCVGNPQNRTILNQEVSYQLLEDFLNAQDSKDIPLIKLLLTN